MSRVLLPNGHSELIDAVLQCGDIPIAGVVNARGMSERLTLLQSKYPEIEIFTMPQFDVLCLGTGYRVINFPVPMENVTGTQLRRVLRGW